MASRKSIFHFGLGMINGFFVFYLLQIVVFYSSTCSNGRFCPSRLTVKLENVGTVTRGNVGAKNPRHLDYALGQRDNFSTVDKEEVTLGASELRVLCWVLTSPANHEKKAKHVLATWGKRCDNTIFMSSQADEALNAIAVIDGEGRDRLWEKTKAAFQYIYEHHLDEADWFLKADDDTYVVMENLRHFLKLYNTSVPLFFGRRLFSPETQSEFMSGGAGYVLSREAVRKLVEEGLPDSRKCRQGGAGPEDVLLGQCAANTGILTGDSRDSEGRERFFPLSSALHVIPIPEDNWLTRLTYYPLTQGLEGMSNTPVSFHYISPTKMYELEYLLYHTRLQGARNQLPALHAPPLHTDHLHTKAFQHISKRN